MRVKALADFDIEDLVPMNHGPKSTIPALFLHGLQDNFVLPRHSEKLYNNYAGDKEIMMFDGDHNNERNEKVIDRGVGFLCRAFRKYELEYMVSQHLADVNSSLPTQEGPHRIPHLPRPSSDRKALGDITNDEKTQRPGARASDSEASVNSIKKNPTRGQATEDSVVGPAVEPNSLRPAPRKFASSVANRRAPSPRNQNSAPRKDVPLTNTVYNTQWKTPGEELESLTPRGQRSGSLTPKGQRAGSQTPRGQENRRPRSKGPTNRSGLKAMVNALATRGGA